MGDGLPVVEIFHNQENYRLHPVKWEYSSFLYAWIIWLYLTKMKKSLGCKWENGFCWVQLSPLVCILGFDNFALICKKTAMQTLSKASQLWQILIRLRWLLTLNWEQAQNSTTHWVEIRNWAIRCRIVDKKCRPCQTNLPALKQNQRPSCEITVQTTVSPP